MAAPREVCLKNTKPWQWKPGNAPYRDYLASLTPEQYQAHLQSRREKKAIRKAMQQVTEHFQAEWISGLHNAAWAVLQRARKTGDPQAFMAVYDRMIGRPQELGQNDGNRPLPWRDED